jgi:hypothetical protein
MGITGIISNLIKSNNESTNIKFLTPNKENDTIENITKVFIDGQFLIPISLEENPELSKINSDINLVRNEKIANKFIEILEEFGNTTEKHVFFESMESVAKINGGIGRKMYNEIKKNIEKDLCEKLNYERIDDEYFDKSLTYFNDDNVRIIGVYIRLISSKKKYNENINFKNLDYFGDTYVHTYIDEKYGEAEHRILNYIKNNSVNIGKEQVYYINSMDTDVIIIALLLTNLLQDKNISVNVCLYHTNFETGLRNKYYFNSKKYIEYIKDKFKNKNNFNKNITNIFYDMVYCIGLFGNDFIPSINMMLGIEELFELIYGNNGNIINYNSTTKIFSVNKNCLINFLHNTKNNDKKKYNHKKNYNINKNDSNQDSYFATVNISDNNKELIFNTMMTQLYFGKYILNNYGFDENILKFVKKKNDNKYNVYIKNNYSIVNINSFDNKYLKENINKEQLEERVVNYLEGFDFILSLYFNSTNDNLAPNYYWYYKDIIAPPLKDIINYLYYNDLPTHNPNKSYEEYFNVDEYIKFHQLVKKINFNTIYNKINDIKYKNLFSENINDRILYSYGTTKFKESYCKNRYFVDPISFKNKDKKIIEKTIHFEKI